MRRTNPTYLAGFPSCIHFLCIQKPAHSSEMFAWIEPVPLHTPNMQPGIFFLCTAKDSIHPQCPQGYPQFFPAKPLQNRGFPPNYPHCPQLIHSTYPICFHMWIFMWTFIGAYFRPSSAAYSFIFIRVRACSARLFCVIRGLEIPDFTAPKTFARNENEIPQRLFICIKKLRTHQGTEHVNHHLFLLLPRMVASGLAACFMKAEGLMPTMFLNCLEK